MKKFLCILTFMLSYLLINSCKGPEGPAGPAGKDGAGVPGPAGKDGIDGQTDKQIRLTLLYPMQTTSDQWIWYLGLIKFDKRNYVGVDSIIFVAQIYSDDTTNYCIAELINNNDTSLIKNSTIKTNKIFKENLYISSGNLYQSFPDKEIDVGVRIRSSIKGFHSTIFYCYLFLYRK